MDLSSWIIIQEWFSQNDLNLKQEIQQTKEIQPEYFSPFSNALKVFFFFFFPFFLFHSSQPFLL